MGKKHLRQKLHGITDKWMESRLFKWIDSQISKSFRKRLKNDNFTILCSNCIGGTIYHRLGKRFLTPTINLYIPQPDFVQFCLHLDYYLAQEIHFVESGNKYPVGELRGDGADKRTITIHFNHDRDPENARQKWDDRKARIVRDNLYIIVYNTDGVTVDELKELEQVPCRNKVVLTAKPLPEISWSFYIKPVMSHSFPYAYLGKDVLQRRGG